MLDRRASELTNLNLVMYSVTDIKNVDEDNDGNTELSGAKGLSSCDYFMYKKYSPDEVNRVVNMFVK